MVSGRLKSMTRDRLAIAVNLPHMSPYRNRVRAIFNLEKAIEDWCPRSESNRHCFRNWILSLPHLPPASIRCEPEV